MFLAVSLKFQQGTNKTTKKKKCKNRHGVKGYPQETYGREDGFRVRKGTVNCLTSKHDIPGD